MTRKAETPTEAPQIAAEQPTTRYVYVGGWGAVLCGLGYADGVVVENQAPRTGTVVVDPGDIVATPAPVQHPMLRPLNDGEHQ